MEDYQEPSLKTMQPSKLPLSEQEKLVAELNEFVQRLEQHLSPVLRATYPTDTINATGPAEAEAASPLNVQLRANNRGINVALSRLRDILERVEV